MDERRPLAVREPGGGAGQLAPYSGHEYVHQAPKSIIIHCAHKRQQGKEIFDCFY